jgi:ABC-type uncharacterized transport system substrate-binding protein
MNQVRRGECRASSVAWIEAKQKYMKKKITVLTLCAMLLALCYSASAQQPGKVPRIGYLSQLDAARDSARTEAVRLALQERGYIEGQNIAIEYRSAEGKIDRASELAAELVRLKVDVIVVSAGNQSIQGVMNTTKTIPIVMVGQGSDPVAAGLVDSLARPGETSPALQALPQNSVASGWSCSKRPFLNLPVLRFSAV